MNPDKRPVYVYSRCDVGTATHYAVTRAMHEWMKKATNLRGYGARLVKRAKRKDAFGSVKDARRELRLVLPAGTRIDRLGFLAMFGYDFKAATVKSLVQKLKDENAEIVASYEFQI